jgi:hypothetical protein
MRASILATALLLAGCAHSGNVHDTGGGTHSVTASANWGGYTASREETIAQANNFCGKSGQRAAIEAFVDQPGVGSKGEYTSTLTFTCTALQAWQRK